MRRDGWIAGFGRVLTASGRLALGIALFCTLVTWSRLAGEAWLPWTLQLVLAGVIFFTTLAMAWVLGAVGGILGWFMGRPQGKADRGPAAGVAGLWAGLAIGIGLTLWAIQRGPPPLAVILLCFVLPLIGPWVAVRWLVDPAIRTWHAAQTGLWTMSHLLGERLILRRGVRLDARGVALGLLAGLAVAAVGMTGLFRYPEAVLLAQGVRLRNQPINTPAGPIELTRWISLYAQGVATTPAEGRIVILQMDDWTQGELIRRSSEPALNALMLRKLAAWRSSAVILPLSQTTLTTPSARPPRRSPSSGNAPPPPGPPPGDRAWRRPLPRHRPVSADSPAPLLNPLGPPLDQAALDRGWRDLPILARALRANDQALLCLLQTAPLRGPVFEWLKRGLWATAPVPRLAPLSLFAPLLAAGRPVGSAEFEPFGVGEVPSLHLTDFRGLWALPLLLATDGDRHLVSPAPSPLTMGTLSIRGRTLQLAAPGRFLVNVYGSQPGAIFPHVSYSAVLNGEPLYDRRQGRWVSPDRFFRDRIVFLDTLNQPTYDTPVGDLRATELLATATDNLLTMDVLAPATPRVQLFFLLLCGALAGHLAIGRSPLRGALRVALLTGFSTLAAAVLFIWPGAWLPVVSVTTTIGLAYLLVVQFVFTADEIELERQRRQQAQFEQEIDIGRAIQTSLLPPGHLTAGPFEIVSRSVPAREVGGDFYNFLPFAVASPPEAPPLSASAATSRPDPDTIGIILGDVSGKGVQGAMYMTVTTTLLEAHAARDCAPEVVLAGANAHLYPKIHGLRMFVTVFYGILEVAAGRLEFASAGQVPPVLASRHGLPRYEPTRGTPLGALSGSRYERRSVLLAPGDTLILASDGFIEARSPRGQVLGYDGFLAMVARHLVSDPTICLEGIFSEIDQFSGGTEEQDDRTLVVIHHHAWAAEQDVNSALESG